MDANELLKRAKELDFAGTHPNSVFVTEIWVVFHELLVLAEELLEAQKAGCSSQVSMRQLRSRMGHCRSRWTQELL